LLTPQPDWLHIHCCAIGGALPWWAVSRCVAAAIREWETFERSRRSSFLSRFLFFLNVLCQAGSGPLDARVMLDEVFFVLLSTPGSGRDGNSRETHGLFTLLCGRLLPAGAGLQRYLDEKVATYVHEGTAVARLIGS
jgi:hypothetical protein